MKAKKSNNKKELVKIATDTGISAGSSIIGSIIGLAVGGVPGSIIGSVVSPAISAGAKIIRGYFDRRKQRVENITDTATLLAGLSQDKIVSDLETNAYKVDEMVKLLKTATESDKSLDGIFSALLANLFLSKDANEQDRIDIFVDALHGLHDIHLKVLLCIDKASGVLGASQISESVGIPEIELRSTVRMLELKGMIRDCEKIPIEWSLRELGKAVVEFSKKGGSKI
ncbi:MAG: hypothetical protein LBL82_06435 [Oscillospiraceae bacterium]|jgi:predicted transcriptional regulator|nr:hypothetical protein [Oscillospiraceae bacterium]